ncbi:MAG: hypothetical protein GC151_08080 [Betaproteobacteria bacterium]|nr:hypothetical protein [Betaproteobacteria bacterium]
MSDVDRVRWRCRRGLLELDLILTRFMESRYGALAPRERDIFLGLLELADNELWDLIAGRMDLPEADRQAMVDQLRAV